MQSMMFSVINDRRSDDDVDVDVYYYICQRLKLEGQTENMSSADRRESKGAQPEKMETLHLSVDGCAQCI